MDNIQEIRKTIDLTIRQVLEDTGRPVKQLHDEQLLLADIGLDSLDLAQLVVLLDQQFGVDPFKMPGPLVRTVGDLVKTYGAAINRKEGELDHTDRNE